MKEKGDKNGANSKEKNGVSGTLQCSTCHAFWARTGQVDWEEKKSTKMQPLSLSEVEGYPWKSN